LIKKNIKSKKELLAVYKKWIKTVKNFSIYFITPYLIEEIFEPKLKEILYKNYKNKGMEIFNIVAYPSIIFKYQQYKLDLVRMGNKIDYEYILNKYKFLNEYTYREKLLSKKDIINDARKLKSKNKIKEIYALGKSAVKNKRLYNNLLNDLSGNYHLKSLIRLIHNYVNIRTERIEIWKLSQSYFRDFYKQLYFILNKEYPNILYEDVLSLTNKEIIDYLKENKLFKFNEIKKRTKGEYISWRNFNNKDFIFIYDKKLLKKLRNKYKVVSSNYKTIVGTPAFKGITRGKVKIINKTSDFIKLKKEIF